MMPAEPSPEQRADNTKLCRAPIPMVRMVAPQMTGIQKLRCCGMEFFQSTVE
jgi:hypothetical protein